MYMRDNVVLVSYYFVTKELRFNISVSLVTCSFVLHKTIYVPVVGIFVKQRFEKKWKYFFFLLLRCCDIFGFLITN